MLRLASSTSASVGTCHSIAPRVVLASLMRVFVAGASGVIGVRLVPLLAAAAAATTPRFLAQSIAWHLSGKRGAAVQEFERMVLEAGGVVLRYGRFYGPGTFYESELPESPRVSVDEAAKTTAD